MKEARPTGDDFERENAQGSVVATNAYPGGMTSRTLYDAYGLQYSLKAGARSRYGYAGVHGYAEDGANGLVLCGARFYLPGIGRFLTRDPIGHDGGLNLYAYCGDNPVGNIDSDGKQAKNLSDAWFKAHLNDPLGSCGRIPHTPLNYTLSFWAREAAFRRDPPMFAFLTGTETSASRYLWFRNEVKSGAPMDFKRLDIPRGRGFDPHHHELVDYGNFNYGVIGTILGISPRQLFTAGGDAYRRDNGGMSYRNLGFDAPFYGDQIRDHFFIQMGINYAHSNDIGRW